MRELPSLEKLTLSFSKLPGVGSKSAERMAYAVLRMDEEDRATFASAIEEVGAKISKCPACGLYREGDACPCCDDEERDHSIICVVEGDRDAMTIEKAGYRGLYHVLGGVISPSKGLLPEGLSVSSLLERVKNGNFQEVILALSPTIEGETTSLYVSKLLSPTGIKVTRLGYGLPMGGSLDYADGLTIEKAFEGRKKI